MSAVSTPKEHNQTIPPEAIVAVQLSQIRRAQEDASSAQGSARAALSKAEGKGINLPAAKRALKILKAGDAETFAAEMQETLRYLKILGVGIQKSQLDLFETATTLAPIDEKAFEDGLLSGRMGEPAETYHDQSTLAGQRWIEGHSSALRNASASSICRPRRRARPRCSTPTRSGGPGRHRRRGAVWRGLAR